MIAGSDCPPLFTLLSVLGGIYARDRGTNRGENQKRPLGAVFEVTALILYSLRNAEEPQQRASGKMPVVGPQFDPL